MTQIVDLSISAMAERLASGELTSIKITESYLGRIDQINAELNAYVNVFHEHARQMARASDERRVRGKILSRYDGIPIALKDNIAYKDQKLTCSSRILKDFHVPYHAHVSQLLLANGIFPLGKTNMDEFAMGSSTENSAFAVTRNPWDTSRVPGGSSGGSAAAVSAGLAPWALGSDTGGSIRLPASFCGVLGLKPTYGRVSRYGLVAYGSSLDQIGPMTQSVEDAAILLDLISGHDSRDSTSSEESYLSQEQGGIPEIDLRGLRVGLPKEYFPDLLDPEVAAILERHKRLLQEAGAQFVEVSLPHTDYAVPVYYLIATAEASSNLARYDGVRYGARDPRVSNILEVYTYSRHAGLGAEVKRRILLGTYVLSSGYYDAYYRKASRVRTLIRRDFQELFSKVDVVLAPVAPTPAFAIGEKTEDPLQMYLSDILTIAVNLAGLPALSVNGGFQGQGLPVGVQWIGNYFQEKRLLGVSRFIEANTEKRVPPARKG